MSRKPKIAVIHNLTKGGAVRVMNELNDFIENFYDIDMYRPCAPKHIKSRGIRKIIDYLGYLYFKLPKSYCEISKEINSSNYKAVIIHHDAYIKSPISLFDIKTKKIYVLHEPPREFYEPLGLHAPLLKDKLFTLLRLPILIMDKLAVRKADYIIVNSNFSKKRVDKLYGVKSRRVYFNASKLFRNMSGIKKKYQCISVGSLLPYKCHDLSISAIAKMTNKPTLVVVGGGRSSEKEALLKLAKFKNVKIKIYNKLTDASLNRLYNESRVYINTAFQEPYGISALEALNTGLDLITVNNCGTVELKKIYGSRVHIVNRDVISISKGIERAISNSRHAQQSKINKNLVKSYEIIKNIIEK